MKALVIALKDVLRRFRDPRALLFMLLTPLVIALIMGAAFSGQNNGASPVYNMPLAVVNADEGELGDMFLDVLAEIQVDTADGRQPLFSLQIVDRVELARAQVEQGQVRAALLLPADFSASLNAAARPAARVHLLTDPTYSVAPVVVESVVRRVAVGFESASLGAVLAAAAARASLDADPEALAALPAAISSAVAEQAAVTRIHWREETLGATREMDLINYFMPSMAIFFLMFSAFASTRSILEEEGQGILPRLLTTPVSRAEILLGKIGGALLGGWLQMAVLMLASALFFGVQWGDLLGALALALVTVVAAAGLGAMVAAFARDETQAGLFGSLITLIFAVLGGNFIPLQNAPDWLNAFSRLTLNRWALDGFTALAFDGASAMAILPHLLVLGGMAVIFFSLALVGFNRRFVR